MELSEIVVAVLVVAVVSGIAWSIFDRSRMTVLEHERALRYDRGRFVGVLGPGRYRRSGRIQLHVVDVRPQVLTVGGQEVLTNDGLSVKISLAVVHAIADPDRAVNHAGFDHTATLYVRLQLALRRLVAEVSLEDLLGDRTGIGARLLADATPVAEDVGVRLDAVDVKDVMLPGDLKRAFAQVAIARQEGLAALERARGETAALRNLANAADDVERRPGLLPLRLLQQLGTSSGHTVVLTLGDTTTPVVVRPPDGDDAR